MRLTDKHILTRNTSSRRRQPRSPV